MSVRVEGFNFGCESTHPLFQGSWEQNLLPKNNIKEILKQERVGCDFCPLCFETGCYDVALSSPELAGFKLIDLPASAF